MNKFIGKSTVLFSLILLSLTVSAVSTPERLYPDDGILTKRLSVHLYTTIFGKYQKVEFQCDTSKNFNSPLKNVEYSTKSNISSNPLKKGTHYYWRARAIDNTDTSDWSVVEDFVTYSTFTTYGNKNDTGNISALFGSKADKNGELTYLFELDYDSTFDSPKKLLVATKSNIYSDSTGFFVDNNSYYWRATVIDPFGDTLNWSVTKKRTIRITPPDFSHLSGKTLLSTIKTDANDAGTMIIHFKCDTTPHFNSKSLKTLIYKEGTYPYVDSLHHLLFGEKYYFTAQTSYMDQKSSWSEIDSFYVSDNIRIRRNDDALIKDVVFEVEWDEIAHVQYQFQVSRYKSFEHIIHDAVLSENEITVPYHFLLNTKYYYRIRAVHPEDSSDWVQQGFWTFDGQPEYTYTWADHTNSIIRTFVTRLYHWADGYIFEIDTGKSFGSEISNKGYRIYGANNLDPKEEYYFKTDPFVLDYGQDYVCRFYAIYGNDTTPPSKSTYITKTLEFPELNFPGNNSKGMGTHTDALIKGIPGSTTVELYIDTNSNFNSSVFQNFYFPHEPDILKPEMVSVKFPDNLMFETKYYWKTRVISDIDTSKWSETWNFSTTTPPRLTQPKNESIKQPKQLTLDWSIQGFTSDYTFQYQLDTSATLDSAEIITLPAGANSEIAITCQPNLTYYWRVRAFHSKDTSSWSSTWKFSTIIELPLKKIELEKPLNNATGLTKNGLTLSWKLGQGAKSYEVHLALDDQFNNVVAMYSPTGNGISFLPLQNNTKYYWRVRGIRNNDKGPWSDIWNFSTEKTDGISTTQTNWLYTYPNPVNRFLYIEGIQIDQICVYDLGGREVAKHRLQSTNNSKIDLSILPNGIYTIKVYTGETVIARKISVFH